MPEGGISTCLFLIVLFLKNNSEKERGSRMKVEIRLEEGSDAYQAEDGTVLLTVRKTLPVVRIEGGETAAAVINEAVRSYVKSGNMSGVSVDEILGWTKADYERRGRDNWKAYELETVYETKRADEKIISFKIVNDSYTGGAHPNVVAGGMTFDTQTGRRLAFADVVKDEKAAMTLVREFLLQETKKEVYAGMFFEGYEAQLGELLKEDTWYLSEVGMHVIGNEYIIAPHAAGIFDFVIPYAQADFMRDEFKR